MKYVQFSYEEPGEPNNYWHIWSDGPEAERVEVEDLSFHIRGPHTDEMWHKIHAICVAIDDAIDASMRMDEHRLHMIEGLKQVIAIHSAPIWWQRLMTASRTRYGKLKNNGN